jgi:hypothetical protein
VTDQTKPDEAKELWQSQKLEGRNMSVEQIRARVAKLGRIVRRRNLIGGFACITVLLSFSYFAMGSVNLLERTGSALTALGAAYIGIQLIRRKMGVRSVGTFRTQANPSVQFYRSELERQRDFHRGVWLWSRLLVLIPGPVLFLVGVANANPSQMKLMVLVAICMFTLLIIAIPRNLRLADQFQRELEDLDSSVGE